MLENLFPNADDFDEMAEHLASIAYALGEEVDVSDWRGIQKAVQLGVAPTVFPIGTQLTDANNRTYIVVAHNHFKTAHIKDAPTMTLMLKDVLSFKAPYDVMEAFYRTDAELPPANYLVTLPYTVGERAAGTYSVTIDTTLPAGTTLHFPFGADDGAFTVEAHHYPSNTYYGEFDMSLGSNGISLGTLGVELNHTHRVFYGSNNYKESAIRQYLNSNAIESGIWVSQTKYDRPAAWLSDSYGFLRNLDSGLRDILVEVIVPCSTNDTFESPDSTTKAGETYTVIDKVFLPSANELGYYSNGIVNDSTTLPYFNKVDNAMRIKYHNDTPVKYWTRSPEGRTSFSVGIINGNGAVDFARANDTECYITPMFNIG